MKILLTNHYEGKPAEIIKSAVPDGFELEMLESVSQQELEGKVKEADYLLVSGRLKINRTVLENATNIKMIQRTGVGLDSIDLEYIRNHDIPFYVNKGVNAQSVAEHTILLMLASLRNLVEINENTKRGIWKKQAQGVCTRELCGKTVGLIGMGAIGTRTAQLARAFGCEVYGYNRSPRETEGVTMTDMDTLLRECDIVSLHVPLTEQTKGLIGEAQLRLMKPNAILVNTARGPVVDSQALAAALEEGRIAGAAVDVFETEPPISEDHPLLKAPRLLATPHVAFATKEALYKRAVIVFDNIACYLDGKPQNVM